jgi:hypothetical protein
VRNFNTTEFSGSADDLQKEAGIFFLRNKNSSEIFVHNKKIRDTIRSYFFSMEVVLETQIIRRKSNFELLRIIAMLMIVASHLGVHGVKHVLFPNLANVAYNGGTFANKIFVSFCSTGGSIGVALFFMISGFFSCRKEKLSIKKISLQTAFYSIFLAVIFASVRILNRFGVIRLTGGGGQ